MSTTERRELQLHDEDGGSTIELTREGHEVTIESVSFYKNHLGNAVPLSLTTEDRIALIDFLNMGEYRRLSYGEAR